MRPRALRSIALLSCLAAAPAGAGSELALPVPTRFGEIPAVTYDPASGARLGAGFIRMSREADGAVRMEGRTGIDGGAQTRVAAELAPAPGGAGLRVLRQESRSVDVAGRPMGVLEIDHAAGEGRCTGPTLDGQPGETRTVALSQPDRVANVPLTLLFQPMVRGEAQELHFQILLCGVRPRVVAAVARVVPRSPDGVPNLLRIRYELSLPKLLAAMAKRWLPHLSFWFDPADAGAWIGHEMPLYAKGPTVLMVREGFPPGPLRDAP